MRVTKLSKNIPINKLFEHLNVTKEGSSILQSKSLIEYFYIKNISTVEANILKQEALSVDADLAVPRGCITCKTKTVDALLLSTQKQLKIVIKKLKKQPFGLKKLADELSFFTGKTKEYKTKIMGIINTNNDSFYEGSRFIGYEAIKKIESMIEEGADL